MPKLRIDKIISDSGAASRRECAALIKRGAVTVDGVAVCSASDKFDPQEVKICVGGRVIDYKPFRYVMLNKPAGYVSATQDRRESTVMELLGEELRGFDLFPAGRLDKDAEGLLLLTNDGDYAHRVISPKKNISKLYYVTVQEPLEDRDRLAFENGIVLTDGTQCLPGELYILSSKQGLVRIHEGKYHQVKRMLAALGKPVEYLKRLCIGGLMLDDALSPGQYRELTVDGAAAVFDKSADECLETLLKQKLWT
ncbi:MAG: 16S rRNA pseudouridine(516) synthase [Oscillospiraceae bacterium]|nr:16S rRNA pseudouridine(516) synthase [Oscillospiraceae bacterium]